jgi:hypothetical protein
MAVAKVRRDVEQVRWHHCRHRLPIIEFDREVISAKELRDLSSPQMARTRTVHCHFVPGWPGLGCHIAARKQAFMDY